ncbi:DUF456 domain-containing protein [Butyrivibrio sp. YAB3001]|uniref:DUF456 domain-containing protein n=1 Tax=Butyrivibrio sp. YAB3001 TaxID=1520812 RepID=UPI0008F623CF|nr:DUF456 domain-containing protein [Butyrivibrio sp. YAB3001]SFB99306.1 hypothetical protein SAMN02910398_01251 [Butyrivibrio sp. YAB3001]
MTKNAFPLITQNLNILPEDAHNLWEEKWNVSLSDDAHTSIGTLHFEDGISHGEVKLSVDLAPEYEKTEYIEEIFYAMAKFVFRLKEIKEISTSCSHENDHRIRGLENAGYVFRNFKDGHDYYSMKRQKSSWTGLYVIVGLIAGFFIGITISNLWLGAIAGVLIGTAMGYLMDKKELD